MFTSIIAHPNKFTMISSFIKTAYNMSTSISTFDNQLFDNLKLWSNQSPIFGLNANQIEILKEPNEFYEKLKVFYVGFNIELLIIIYHSNCHRKAMNALRCLHFILGLVILKWIWFVMLLIIQFNYSFIF